MKTEEITLKVITPMFMLGADNKTPELRPSEFKGMMRFWWRAIRACDDIDKLKKEEVEIFGGSGENEGKSKVKITLKPIQIAYGEYRVLPHSETKFFKSNSIKENSTFKILLTTYDDNYFETAKNALLISILVGGFGKRSRRGFGSCQIINSQQLNFENLSEQEFMNKICETLNKISSTYSIQKENNNVKIKNNQKGENYPWIREIIIGRGDNSWENLLKRIGNASHKNCDPSLGSGKPRMASPVYVSIVKLKDKYYPIITELNFYFPKNYPRYNFQKKNDFIREVVL
jgi:CRISPR-associated protein Cmr1